MDTSRYAALFLSEARDSLAAARAALLDDAALGLLQLVVVDLLQGLVKDPDEPFVEDEKAEGRRRSGA